MKSQVFAQILTASVIALGTIATISQPSYAQRSTFFCDKSREGIPTTFARTATGKRIAVISWRKDWGGNYPPEKRCRDVSARFQSADQDQVLNYMTVASMRGQQVVCAIRKYGNTCDQLLFTLKQGENPREVIRALTDINYRARGPLVQSEDGSPQIYVDMNLLLSDETQVEEGSSY